MFKTARCPDRYGLALALTGAAVALHWFLQNHLPPQFPLFALTIAVTATVWLAGFGPALFVAVLTYVIVSLLSAVNPAHLLTDASLLQGSFLYLISCALIIAPAALLHSHRERRRCTGGRLECNEREIEDFMENAIVPMHRVDRHGNIIWANRAELDLLGFRAEEYIGHPIADFHENQGELAGMLRQLKAGGEVRNWRARLHRKDGGVEDVLIHGNALFRKGEFVHTRCCTQPITERSELEENGARLAAIVSASDDIIINMSLDGIIRSWNPGAERLLGFSRSEMVGRHITAIIPPELRHEENRILAKVRNGERVDHFETVRLTDVNQRIDLSITVSPVFDDRGKVIGACKVARDITDRKYAERMLRASELRFRQMADAAPVLLWIAGPDRRRHWFNKRWLEFTGRTIEQELGNGWIDNLHPDDVEATEQLYSKVFAARAPFTTEYRLKRWDGQYRWVLVNGVPLLGAIGEFSGYIGSCIDITDRKAAEQALRDADRRKNEFLATLAHELRNPLAPIRNSLEILKRTDGSAGTLHRCRETIDRQLTHMVRLVDDLLNISRISRDKLTLRTGPTDLASVVRQAVETVQPLLDERRHRLAMYMPEQTIELDADAVRLGQVLTNLLNNACKFTDPGGDITLAVTRQEEEVVVSVRDNGIGIAPDHLNDVFEMFGQSDTSRGRSLDGLGIGLTIAKRLVEMHGGRLTGHSEGVGKGSEFVVSLPVAGSTSPVVPDTKKCTPGNAAGVEAQRVLVVDDNRDNADTLSTLLELNGHQVHCVHDGDSALDVLDRFRPRMVLLDIGLPDMDGFEVCRRMRKREEYGRLTIVAITGWGQDEDHRNSRQAGFDAHLVKPVSYHALIELLGNLESGTKPAPESSAKA